MVFFLTAKDGSLLYVGRDKYENEDLIKHGWPEDVWFHVDNLSSPHVYVRMPRGQAMESLSEDAIRDAAQWCKQGSIDGCKKASVTIVYTPWSNLRKDAGMDAGQVGFFNDKLVKKYVVLEKDRETLRRLDKTKEERYPDLGAERKARDEEERAKIKAATREKSKAEKELDETRRKEKADRSYDRLFKKDETCAGAGSSSDTGLEPTADATAAVKFEDDFM